MGTNERLFRNFGKASNFEGMGNLQIEQMPNCYCFSEITGYNWSFIIHKTHSIEISSVYSITINAIEFETQPNLCQM